MVAADLAAAFRAGASLDFTRDPERPVLRYPPDSDAERLVCALLAEEQRAELRRILTTAAAYRRATARSDPEAARLAEELGPAVAEAVRRAIPRDAFPPVTHRDAFYRDEFVRARASRSSDRTRHDASPGPMRQPPARPASSPPVYAHPWPDALPSLGRRTVGALDTCACGASSWVRYGARVFCLPCARSIAAETKA